MSNGRDEMQALVDSALHEFPCSVVQLPIGWSIRFGLPRVDDHPTLPPMHGDTAPDRIEMSKQTLPMNYPKR